ncbi:MAG: glycosyltransferase family 2 protein [Pseudomonadota bacterium]
MTQAVIVIPAYNAAATVARAVESALRQTALCAVVVVDDCSKDDTVRVAEGCDDGSGRLTVLRQEINRGPAAARNRAIEASDAPWIALLDSDDEMEPDRVRQLLDSAGDDWDFLADDLWKVAEGEPAEARTRLLSPSDFKPITLDLASFVEGNLHSSRGNRSELGFIKPLMRRAFLDRHGLRYDDAMRLAEDYDLYARALASGARFQVINPCGYVATVRRTSLSGNHRTEDLRRIVEADRRLLARPGLTDAERRALKRHFCQNQREWSWRRLIDSVKARDPVRSLSCFVAHPHVGWFLIGKLAEQGWLRLIRRLSPSGSV